MGETVKSQSLTPEVTPYAYFSSALGNALFSGLTVEEIWCIVSLCESEEQLDAAVSATIKLKELTDDRMGN